MNTFAARCHHIAGRLTRQALSGALFIALVLAAAIPIPILSPGPRPLLTALLVAASLATGIVSLAHSVLLRFDAALFTGMASHADEIAGGRAVDEFLAKAKLKPLPATARPLTDRITGARRLMRRQVLLAAATAILAILALAANLA